MVPRALYSLATDYLRLLSAGFLTEPVIKNTVRLHFPCLVAT